MYAIEQELRTSLALFLQTYREDCRDNPAVTASWRAQCLLNLIKDRYGVDLVKEVRNAGIK
jgi:hypothetical protein